MRYAMLNPVLFGEGTVKETGKEAKGLGITKALVVSDSFLCTTDGYRKCLDSLKAENIDVVEFKDCPQDPPDTTIDEGGMLARNEKVNGVIAFGGGSVLDTGKAISILVNNPPPIRQYIGSFNKEPEAPLIAIPTSAGTGSEATMACVITDTTVHKKLSAFATAKLSIIDPELTYSAPPRLTANSALDVLAHCCEALTQYDTYASPFSDTLALSAIERVVKYLPVAMRNGYDVEARRNLCAASNFGGIAMQNGTTHMGHCVAHAVGAALHLPHGLICALGLPVFVRYTASYMPEKTKQIGEAFGAKLSEASSAVEIGEIAFEAVRSFVKACQFPSFADKGVSENELTALAEDVLNDPTWFIVPQKLSLEEMTQYLRDMYHVI